MKKFVMRALSVLLTVIMCVSFLSMGVFAATTTEDGNIWYGDEVAVDVTAGTEGYNYMSLFRKFVHGYEFGGHFLGDGEGPQTFVVIDTAAHDGTTWKPSGVFDPMSSNYDVTYCCDVETMIVDGTYYKRINLEDAEYYDADQAAKIRAIVTNAYPYVSLDDMKADLAENGYAYAEALTRNEVIAAVQAAIWCCANDMSAEELRYQKSYKVSDNLQWGYPLHDTSADSGLDVSGKRVFKTYEEVGIRIDSLVDYLLEQEATYADKAQIIVSSLEMMGAPVEIDEGTYSVKLKLILNNSGSGYEDNINITVTAGDETFIVPVELGKETYELQVIAKAGEEIKAVVSGTQVLPAGVYFYQPKAADADGDGVATSREVSQNLVGVAMGATPVYAEASIKPEEVTFNTTAVSGIKIWNDEDNLDGIRPESITVNLFANGVKIDSTTVTEADEWKWSFEGLFKYENGAEIVYTVTEDVVEGYTTEITGNAAEGFVIENTHELTEIEEPPVPLVPNTGDNFLFFLVTAILSGAAIVLFVDNRRKFAC